MKKGLFITFEGIDGAGKSTHIEPMAKMMRDAGYKVMVTREPGGTALAEKLRELILQMDMDAMTEALLVFAARRDHIKKVIRPALARGEVVLCDRFTDSTFAYQGYGRGFSQDVLHDLEGWVQGDVTRPAGMAAQRRVLQPDFTFLYDLDPAIAAKRLAGVRAADRFEAEQAEFFSRVRAGYLARKAAREGRFVVVDASRTPEEVWAQTSGYVLDLFAMAANRRFDGEVACDERAS